MNEMLFGTAPESWIYWLVAFGCLLGIYALVHLVSGQDRERKPPPQAAGLKRDRKHLDAALNVTPFNRRIH